MQYLGQPVPITATLYMVIMDWAATGKDRADMGDVVGENVYLYDLIDDVVVGYFVCKHEEEVVYYISDTLIARYFARD